MREKMKTCQLGCMLPVIVGILEEGAAAGEFFVTDVPATAEMLMRINLQFTDEIAFLLAREDSEEKVLDEAIRKLNVYRAAIERILIAPFGSISLMEPKELQMLTQSVLKERVRRRADALLNK